MSDDLDDFYSDEFGFDEREEDEEVMEVETENMEKEMTIDPKIRTHNFQCLPDGHDRCVPAFSFHKKLGILVTGTHAAESEIIIWKISPDPKTGFSFKSLKKLHHHKGYICVLLRWSDDVCVSCGDADPNLNFFSVVPPYKVVKRILLPTDGARVRNGGIGNFLLRSRNEDVLICLTYTAKLLIISHSRGEVVKELDVSLKIGFMKKMVWSKMDSNCFFVATDDKKCSIKLIDYKADRLVQDYTEHSENITTIQTYLNEVNQEILLCGGNERTLFFYRVKGISEDERRRKKKKYRFLFRKVFVGRQIYSSIVIKNSYCCTGDARGFLTIFDLKRTKNDDKENEEEEEEEEEKRGKKGLVFSEEMKVKKEESWTVGRSIGGIWGFVVIDVNENEGCASLVLGSDRKTCCLSFCQILGLSFRKSWSKIEKQDFLERKEFLFEDHEKYLFETKLLFFVGLNNVRLKTLKILMI